MLCNDIHELWKKKNKDYGDSFGTSFNKYGMTMSCIRLGDKFSRLEALVANKEQQVLDESIEDTLIDLANYAIMTVVELRRSRGV